MQFTKFNQIINILFINKKSTIYTITFLIITCILIPLEYLGLLMLSSLTDSISQFQTLNNLNSNFNFLFGLPINSLKEYGILLLVILLISFILKYFQFYLSHFISSYLDSLLSIQSFGRILNLRLSTKDDNNTSKYLSDLRSLCDIKAGIVLPILQIFYSLISSSVILYGLIRLSNKYILLFGFILLFVYLFLIFGLTPRLRKISKDLSIRFGKIYTVPMYACRDLINIRLYNQENSILGKFKNEYKLLKKIELQRSIIAGSPKMILEWVILSSFVCIFLAFTLIGNSSQLVSGFSVYLYAILKIVPSFQLAYTSFTTFSTNSFLLKSIKEFNKIKSYKNKFFKVLDDSSRNNISKINKFETLEINSFSKLYSNKKPIFSGFNLKLPNKGIYQFVGESGCGKSTLMKCIAGLDFEYEGRISLITRKGKFRNELVDQFSTTPSYWYSFISYVPQNIILKNESIISNIAFGKDIRFLTKKEKENINKAIKKACLNTFIESLPNGLDTQINQFGGTLSGGQIQRISLARSFFKGAPIMLLDEATSALDPNTEKYILNSLKEYAKDHLIIFITHRDTSLISKNIIKLT